MVIKGSKLTYTLTFGALEYNENNRTVFKSELTGDDFIVEIMYTFSDVPLVLKGKARVGDVAEIVAYPHRIEMYINGKLTDEEWPAGTFKGKDFSNIGFGKVRDITVDEDAPMPCVLGEFENAEGWRPADNVFVGDCMPYVSKGRYHVLYLKDRRHHQSKWNLGAHQWEHISTGDFVKWQIHPTAVKITDPKEASVCTGSWIEHCGKEYLFYTIRPCMASEKATICRSVSYDGYNFKKDRAFGFTLSDKYNVNHARDPKIFKGEDGLYHMLITTAKADCGSGCLMHLVSDNLDNWQELEPIYVASKELDEPECPDYFVLDGTYYLVYSHFGRARYMYSDNPFDGWKVPKDPFVPCEGVPKAGIFNGRLIFTGFKRIDGYAGTLTFAEATKKENGELVFAELKY